MSQDSNIAAIRALYAAAAAQYQDEARIRAEWPPDMPAALVPTPQLAIAEIAALDDLVAVRTGLPGSIDLFRVRGGQVRGFWCLADPPPRLPLAALLAAGPPDA